MATLQTQYREYLKTNNLSPESCTYDYWLNNIHGTKFNSFDFESLSIGEINLKKVDNFVYAVAFNQKYIGDFVLDVDGYYYFHIDNNKGSWTEYSLRVVADALEELNKPYNDYFKFKRINDIV